MCPTDPHTRVHLDEFVSVGGFVSVGEGGGGLQLHVRERVCVCVCLCVCECRTYPLLLVHLTKFVSVSEVYALTNLTNVL